jgi:phosphoglycolate phosphatase-like HAD superfamily hydrolase
MLAAGHPDAESEIHVRAVCDRYVQLLEREFEGGRRTSSVFPGVRELLDALEARADVMLGLLTGNIAAGARLKLAAVEIEMERFRVGAFGSDSADRRALPSIAAARAAELMVTEPQGEQIVIIGDTPADVTCGESMGARALGVATGSYVAADLHAAGAYAVFEDLSHTDGVVAAIFA